MKILLITVQYYPALNPNVYRWAAIAEYWAEQGHEVHVLCTRRSGHPADEQINGVWVHRAGQATLLDAVYNLLGVGKRRGEASNRKLKVGGWRLKVEGWRLKVEGWRLKVGSRKGQPLTMFLRLALERLVDLTWRSVYWPDGSCLWYGPGRRRALQLHRAHSFDAMISVCLPFTSNLIGWALKRRYPGIRWLVDVEDPFAFQEEQPKNNYRLYGRLNFRMEKRVLEAADAVSLTVESARQRYIQHFGMADKLSVTPPMYNDRQARQAAEAPVSLEEGTIHLAYIGSFYRRIREPAPLLALLDAVFRQYPELARRLTVHIIGEIEAEIRMQFGQYPHLAPIIRMHGLLPRATVFAWMEKVDFLINIGNTTSYQIPSKTVDYLAAGKPVINLYQEEGDTFRAFFADYPCILNVYCPPGGDPQNNASFLAAFIRQYRGRRVAPEYLADRLRPYRLASIAGRYRQLLQDQGTI